MNNSHLFIGCSFTYMSYFGVASPGFVQTVELHSLFVLGYCRVGGQLVGAFIYVLYSALICLSR